VLTRVASSHIRIGTFQYFAARGDMEAVERLSGYVIDRHFPDARASERPILTLLQTVADRQASLIARWMQVGFVHGVMNTDNTALSGETIDFGPCAFMDSYDPATTFSAIDELGRYAYGNQPTIAQWNLARFAETLLPLLDPEPERAVELANETIFAFTSRFQQHWLAGMRDKLGLSSNEEGDLELAHALLRAMQENGADFTLTFRRLCDAAADEKADADVRALFANPAAYDSWVARWRSRLAAESIDPAARTQAMRTVNPAFTPRNHRVEQALDAAIEYGDFSPFAELLTVLSRPYEDQGVFADYANPPHADELVSRTFCGT
jgi:serine/tyrosine/threonine adenylyltransferase